MASALSKYDKHMYDKHTFRELWARMTRFSMSTLLPWGTNCNTIAMESSVKRDSAVREQK